MLTQCFRSLLLVFIVWSLAACRGSYQGVTSAIATQAVATETSLVVTPTATQAPPTSTPTAAPTENPSTLSLELLRNSLYHSPDWGEFQLSEGVYYRPPPTSQESPETYKTHLLDLVLFGDLNADGVNDAVVFLSTQNGGTGHFIEMAAVLNVNGSAQNISTLYLGDRVIIESGVIVNGTLTLDMRISGPNDGACCPSQAVTWSFLLENGQWVQTL